LRMYKKIKIITNIKDESEYGILVSD